MGRRRPSDRLFSLLQICSSKSNLKVHFRTHIRVKPYTCKYCEYDCMHHSSIKDHLTKNHPDKPHTSIEPGSVVLSSSPHRSHRRFASFSYNYNSQAVPEPDEFNAVDFDPAKFVEQQTQCKQRQSLVLENNGTVKYTQTTTTTTTKNQAKRFRSETNLLPSPTVPTVPSTPFPLWPFNLYHPSYFPAMINALRMSTLQPHPMLNTDDAVRHPTSNRKSSFEIEGILNLSLRDKKRKTLEETLSTDEDESI